MWKQCKTKHKMSANTPRPKDLPDMIQLSRCEFRHVSEQKNRNRKLWTWVANSTSYMIWYERIATTWRARILPFSHKYTDTDTHTHTQTDFKCGHFKTQNIQWRGTKIYMIHKNEPNKLLTCYDERDKQAKERYIFMQCPADACFLLATDLTTIHSVPAYHLALSE